MRNLFSILTVLFLGSYCCAAQKVIEKEFSAERLYKLTIEDDSIFSIRVTTSKRESIKMKLHVSGEHSEAIIIEENRSKDELALNSALMPYFTFENDKLAAHKVMAIEVELLVPETISVEIRSKLASLETKGKFPNLAVSLQKGSCTITHFLGHAHLKTTDGNISVNAIKGVVCRAISKNGTVENRLSKQGKYLVKAESVNGNISMLQTE